ncbi:sugar phosphate isomerase/epimerase family protein [Membranihabitans marinus]|uniref:sugar phosphate isomerase/epimerase family protein n=1 Tax=Membranihabitans marinus TaxID=1227546 RepID=UPI001F2169BA|nr:sugar phosphate isomerase/epimerase family protein [Membranihabitans marinus]
MSKSQSKQMNRRAFNQALALTASGAMLSPHSLLNSSMMKKGKNMKLGLVTYLWGKDWDLETLITNCEKSKLYGVELRIEHAHNVHLGMSAQARQEVKMRFADTKVQCLGMGTNQDYHHTDAQKLRDSIEQTKEYIKLSHDIGGTGVKVKPNAFPKGVSKQKTLEQIGRSLNEVAKYAADYGQQIRVEVHGRGTQELPHMKTIFDVADHPNATVCWNSNDEDLIGGGLEYNFNLVKDRFGDTVHIREMNEGDYPYPQLMKLFKEMDYNGWILLECRTKPADTVEAMKEQRKIFKKLIKG